MEFVLVGVEFVLDKLFVLFKDFGFALVVVEIIFEELAALFNKSDVILDLIIFVSIDRKFVELISELIFVNVEFALDKLFVSFKDLEFALVIVDIIFDEFAALFNNSDVIIFVSID